MPQRRLWRDEAPSPLAPAPASEGIHLQVLNQHGNPAVSARVEAYPPGEWWRRWTGDTNAEGRADVNVPDGTWTLVVSSEGDHFVVVLEGVVAPGSLTLDTSGTVLVEALGRRLDVQPLANTFLSFERFRGGINHVGWTDSQGRLYVNLTPGSYCAVAASWDDHYFLNRRQLSVTGPATVLFDAQQMGTGLVILNVPPDADMGLVPREEPPCRSWSPGFDVTRGITSTVSADRYRLGIDRDIEDVNDIRWLYFYDAKDTPHDIVTGSLTTLWAGGTHAASVSPRQPSYAPASRVTLDVLVTDGYGNRLQQVSQGPEQTVVLAHLVVTGPQGNTVYDGNCRWTWAQPCTFDLAGDAAQGTYVVQLSLDTGPLQGLLHASTSFVVAGSPLPVTPSATRTATQTPTITRTPTRTATPTMTPSRTPTSTPTPLAPWLNWRDPGRHLLLPPGGMARDVVYGNMPVPSTLYAKLQGPSVFLSDGQLITTSVTISSGSRTLYFLPAAGALRGSTFTLTVSLENRLLEDTGTIALAVYLPVILMNN